MRLSIDDSGGTVAVMEAATGRTITHFGDWLKREIESIPADQKDWAARNQIPFATLRVWLGKRRPNIRGTNLTRLSRALNLSREELENLLNSVPAEPAEAAAPRRQIELLNRPGETIPLPERIPVINKISASRWSERTDLGYAEGHADQYVELNDPNLFGLVCDGDCMEPDWHDGEYVLFSPLLIERNGIRDGDDCGVQLDGAGDGQSTFKRVFHDPQNPDVLILKCANPKLRAVMRVQREQVIRIGLAVWAMRPAKRK